MGCTQAFVVVCGLALSTAAVAQEDAESPPPAARSSSSSGAAGAHPLALGLTIGSPIGFAGRYEIGSPALQWSVGSFGGDEYGGVLDLLFLPVPHLATGPYGAVFLDAGAGVAVEIDGNGGNGRGDVGFGIYDQAVFQQSPYFFATPSDLAVDLHGVVGLRVLFPDAPVHLFAQFAPGILLAPQLGFGARLMIGGLFGV